MGNDICIVALLNYMSNISYLFSLFFSNICISGTFLRMKNSNFKGEK